MKNTFNFKTAMLLSFVALSSLSIPASAQSSASFDNVIWSDDTENPPSQDDSGCGSSPSVEGQTNQSGPFTFELDGCTNEDGVTQRQEFRYDDRDGFTRMTGSFVIDPSLTDFDKISIAQTHDLQTGSVGVFSIYQIRQDGDGYVFGVQGDVQDVSNQYSSFPTVSVSLGETYNIDIKTNTIGQDSFETTTLTDSAGTQVWENTVIGGGDDVQYKKIGAYQLTDGFGNMSITWSNIQFQTGIE